MTGHTVQQPPWIKRRFRAAGRGLALYLMSTTVGLLLFNLMVTGLSLIEIGIGIFLIPLAARGTRWFADLNRRLSGSWTGVEIAEPYLPRPEPREGLVGWWDQTISALTDPAVWRDQVWLLGNAFVGAFLGALPAWLIVHGVFGVVLAAGVWDPIVAADDTYWYTFIPVSGQMSALVAGATGIVYMTVGLLLAERMLHLQGRWNRVLLSPTEASREKARLAERVEQLTETRADAVDSQAAELRRIERDLHDGAQARLVAMGMSLGAIEHLLERDPEKAKLLLSEARKSSAKALNELRDLVRGIHPPVLSDRGLVDAVRALALDNPLQVEVAADLPGRPELPVESAAYFAIAEALTNATKHAAAERVWIDIRHERGMLRLTVTDDGRGGASLSQGTGLRGVERRLGTFDGVLALSSPPGGPTIVTMEVPCALSSPRISPS